MDSQCLLTNDGSLCFLLSPVIYSCVVGLLAFKLLGGRFWAISPSSFTNLGSFARWSIPCTEKYANTAQRTMITNQGQRWGCHTCGSRMILSTSHSRGGQAHKFVADHMPPKSVAELMNQSWVRRVGILRKVKFRFFPQCTNCSNTQGYVLGKASSQVWKLPSYLRAGKLRQSGGGRLSHFHGLRFRVNHITGAVVAGATVVGATDREITKGNPKRFASMERQINDLVTKATKR
jgi:hypothetical protein